MQKWSNDSIAIAPLFPLSNAAMIDKFIGRSTVSEHPPRSHQEISYNNFQLIAPSLQELDRTNWHQMPTLRASLVTRTPGTPEILSHRSHFKTRYVQHVPEDLGRDMQGEYAYCPQCACIEVCNSQITAKLHVRHKLLRM